MSIKVRYFASLKELLGCSEDEVEHEQGMTVNGVWLKANPEVGTPENLLAAINMEYVTMEESVSDDDIVAFFPPVTGG